MIIWKERKGVWQNSVPLPDYKKEKKTQIRNRRELPHLMKGICGNPWLTSYLMAKDGMLALSGQKQGCLLSPFLNIVLDNVGNIIQMLEISSQGS